MKPTAALVEVVLVFAATHVIYRGVKRFTTVGEWETAAGTNFIPGAVMVIVTVVALLLGRRPFEPYGLSLRRWPYDLNLGLIVGVMVIALGMVALGITGLLRLLALQAPMPIVQTVGTPFLGLLLLAGLLFLLRRWRGVPQVPPLVSVGILIGLLALPMLMAVSLEQPPVWSMVLWNFFCSGLGEEVFFRGYIQSRADAGFGRPWRVLRCNIGPGLMVSSLLFGLIHALNTVDYFNGLWTLNWRYGLQTVFVGLLFGYLRARTQSVWPGGVTHGLLDVFAIVPSLLRKG